MISGAGKSKSPLLWRISLSIHITLPHPDSRELSLSPRNPRAQSRQDRPGVPREWMIQLPSLCVHSSEDHCPVARDDPHQGTLPNRIGPQKPLLAPRGDPAPFLSLLSGRWRWSTHGQRGVLQPQSQRDTGYTRPAGEGQQEPRAAPEVQPDPSVILVCHLVAVAGTASREAPPRPVSTRAAISLCTQGHVSRKAL